MLYTFTYLITHVLCAATRFEVWLILSHRMFNYEKRLLTTSCGRILCFEEILKLHDAEYVDQVFDVNRRIRALDLNYEETCTLGGFVMMMPGHYSSFIRSGSVL